MRCEANTPTKTVDRRAEGRTLLSSLVVDRLLVSGASGTPWQALGRGSSMLGAEESLLLRVVWCDQLLGS